MIIRAFKKLVPTYFRRLQPLIIFIESENDGYEIHLESNGNGYLQCIQIVKLSIEDPSTIVLHSDKNYEEIDLIQALTLGIPHITELLNISLKSKGAVFSDALTIFKKIIEHQVPIEHRKPIMEIVESLEIVFAQLEKDE